jgi:hypothetical protein
MEGRGCLVAPERSMTTDEGWAERAEENDAGLVTMNKEDVVDVAIDDGRSPVACFPPTWPSVVVKAGGGGGPAAWPAIPANNPAPIPGPMGIEAPTRPLYIWSIWGLSCWPKGVERKSAGRPT